MMTGQPFYCSSGEEFPQSSHVPFVNNRVVRPVLSRKTPQMGRVGVALENCEGVYTAREYVLDHTHEITPPEPVLTYHNLVTSDHCSVQVAGWANPFWWCQTELAARPRRGAVRGHEPR